MSAETAAHQTQPIETPKNTYLPSHFGAQLWDNFHQVFNCPALFEHTQRIEFTGVSHKEQHGSQRVHNEDKVVSWQAEELGTTAQCTASRRGLESTCAGLAM